MERKSRDSMGYKIESQIRADFGKIVCEYECHNSEAKKLTKRINILRISEAIISAAAVGCFITYLITGIKTYCIIGTCASTITMMVLILNAYTNGYNLAEIREEHQHSADLLYTLKEKYLTLITSLDIYDVQTVINKREELQSHFYDICKNAPKISEKYKATVMKKLNEKNETAFTDDAIDNMLPEWVRRTHAAQSSDSPSYIIKTEEAQKNNVEKPVSDSSPINKETAENKPDGKSETNKASSSSDEPNKTEDSLSAPYVVTNSNSAASVSDADKPVNHKEPEKVEATDIAD